MSSHPKQHHPRHHPNHHTAAHKHPHSHQGIIVITCANSNNSKEAAKILKSQGAHLRLVVRDPTKNKELEQYGQVVKGDLADEASMKMAFKGAHAVYLVTPMVENIDALVASALKVAKDEGVKFILYLSAMGAKKGAQKYWIANSHGVREEMVKSSGLDYAILEPTFFQSNTWVYNAPMIKSTGKYKGSAGNGKYTAISVHDIAECAALLLTHPEEHHDQTYQLTGSEAFTEKEVAALISKVIGKQVEYVDLSPEDFLKEATSWGLPGWHAESLVALENGKRQGAFANVLPDCESLLGRKQTTYQQSLEQHKGALLM